MALSEFMTRIQERGYFHQCTHLEALDALMAEGKPVSAYIGFDCTAPSLHVGSLMQIMILRHLQQCGHKPIVLLGGFTTKVGDPSGKDASRIALDDATIERNKAGIRTVFEQFLTFGDGETDAVMVDNDEWLSTLNLTTYLRDIGRHFSINRMTKMDSVRLRLEREQELSYLEFSYMLLQSYDFVELYKRYGCRLQIGGSDQWGNIVMGADLHRRLLAESSDYRHSREGGNPEISSDWIPASAGMTGLVFGLTTPLLTTASGTKMGKTADGAVWLNPEMLSAYDYWQFWRNCDDADVGKFLKLFTELSLEEIAALEALEGAGINEAKKTLATEATALLHGRAAATLAAETARRTFEEGASDANLPTVTLSCDEVGEGIAAFKLFHLAGLAASGAEARRLIQGGGAKINDEKVSDENAMITLLDGVTLKLSSGKKKHVLVKVE
jgi:tyrosyl-tRNA synthetase